MSRESPRTDVVCISPVQTNNSLAVSLPEGLERRVRGTKKGVFGHAESIFEVSTTPRVLLGAQNPKISAFLLEMRAPRYLGN